MTKWRVQWNTRWLVGPDYGQRIVVRVLNPRKPEITHTKDAGGA